MIHADGEHVEGDERRRLTLHGLTAYAWGLTNEIGESSIVRFVDGEPWHIAEDNLEAAGGDDSGTVCLEPLKDGSDRICADGKHTESGEERTLAIHVLTAYAWGIIDDLVDRPTLRFVDGEPWHNAEGNIETVHRWGEGEVDVKIATSPRAGYYEVLVDGKSIEDGPRYLGVHRLAAYAWGMIDGLDDPREIHHVDGVPSHNAEGNLEPLSTADHSTVNHKALRRESNLAD